MKRAIVRSISMVGLLLLGPAYAISGDNTLPIAENDIALWNSAIAQGNPDRIASLFAQDAILIQPSGAVVRDREQIRRFWKSLLDSGQGQLHFKLVKARSEDEHTVVTRAVLSSSKPLGAPGEVIDFKYKGVINDVLKLQNDGSWKVQVQRWNDGSRLIEEKDEPTP